MSETAFGSQRSAFSKRENKNLYDLSVLSGKDHTIIY